jgi:hypothetical protein
VHTNYDKHSERAYVEREPDSNGGEIIVTAIFSYRRTTK